jgi:heme/copper-type cytochrome/quinol oxidase subunit 2
MAVVAAGAVLALLAVLVLVPAQSFAQGCAMCATYLSNGEDPRAEAFKISMLFLMSMPFVIVGTVGGWILWMYRRSRPQRAALRALRTEREGTS